MKYLALTVVLVTALFVSAPTAEASCGALKSASNGGTYTDAQGWSVVPPTGWSYETCGDNNFTMTTFYAPGKWASFRVMSTDYPYGKGDKKNLSAYVKLKETTLGQDLTDFDLTKKKKSKLDGESAQFFDATWSQGGQTDRTQIYMVSLNGRSYEVTATATDAGWSSYASAFSDALATFAFSKPLSLSEMPWGEEKFREFIKGTNFAGAGFVGTDNDFIDGGPGKDTVQYSGPRSQYELIRAKDHKKEGYSKVVIVLDWNTNDYDVVVNTEVITFSDQTLSLPNFKKLKK
jgi:hypothetical protein